jgi:hypothetical protein
MKTLELATTKGAALPEAAQEQLDRELLERIDSLSKFRAEIGAGGASWTPGWAKNSTSRTSSDKPAMSTPQDSCRPNDSSAGLNRQLHHIIEGRQ